MWPMCGMRTKMIKYFCKKKRKQQTKSPFDAQLHANAARNLSSSIQSRIHHASTMKPLVMLLVLSQRKST